MDTPKSRSSTPSKWLRFQERFSRSPKISVEAQGSTSTHDRERDCYGGYLDPPFLTQRTTSIPRAVTPISSTSTVHMPLMMTPPRAEPFVRAKPPSRQKNYSQVRCCFCDEPLTSRIIQVEKIIHLMCDHMCHEECLWLLINDAPQPSLELHKIFPRCTICDRVAYPKDDTTRDSLVSRYLINPQHETYRQRDPEEVLRRQTQGPQSAEQKFHSLSLQSKNSKELSIHIPGDTNPAPKPQAPQVPRYKTHKSRGSSISAISSIVSSVPKSPSPTTQTFNSNDMALAILRSEQISYLLQQLTLNGVTNITETDIDTMGVLRLVDKLNVSVDGNEFREYIVYLFQYELMLVRSGYRRMKVYSLQKLTISTPNKDTLELFLQKTGFLIKQRDSSILQKWIAGLCDLEQHFNCENLSSTIMPDDVRPAMGYVEKTEDEAHEVLLPVLLSPVKLTPVDTQPPIQFEKPRALILVIDHHIPLQSNNIITLQNICRVLQPKFESSRLICSMNSLYKVYTQDVDHIGNPLEFSGPVVDNLGDVEEGVGICIISTRDLSSALSAIPLNNQVCIHVGQPKSKSTNQVTCLPSWDDVMECLINKYEISLGDYSTIEFDNDDEFDSDFDSGFDSDFVGTGGDEQNDGLSVDTSDENNAGEVEQDEQGGEEEGVKKDAQWDELFQNIDDALRENTTAQ